MGERQHELRWVHPPLQERSQQTMERLLEAAESLVAEVGFANATVADIARRAESSVGAFYARFKDKHGLLRCLLDRFVQGSLATVSHALRPELWAETGIEELSRTLIRFTMQMLSERQQLIRAIAQLALEEPELATYRALLSSHCAEELQLLLDRRGEKLACSDPGQALRVVTWTCLSMFEASAIGACGNRPAGLSSEQFESELSKMILSYLQVVPSTDGVSTETKGSAL